MVGGLDLWNPITHFTLGVQEVHGIQEFPTTITLITPCIIKPTEWTGAFHKTVSQKPIRSNTQLHVLHYTKSCTDIRLAKLCWQVTICLLHMLQQNLSISNLSEQRKPSRYLYDFKVLRVKYKWKRWLEIINDTNIATIFEKMVFEILKFNCTHIIRNDEWNLTWCALLL